MVECLAMMCRSSGESGRRTHAWGHSGTIKSLIRITTELQSRQYQNCNKDLPAEGALACQGGSSVVEEPFYVFVHPSIFAPPPSSSSTCLPHISCMGQGIFNALVIFAVDWGSHILLLWNILLFISKFSTVLTSFPSASAAHHLSVSWALLSVSASSACSPAVFLLGYWAWSPQEALDSPFSKETEF